MLYDHKKDPNENRNVSENPEYAPVVEKLAEKLEQHRKAVKGMDVASGLGTTNNVPPVWKSQKFQQKAATAGQSYMNYINWRVSDADGDALVYAKLSGPEWLSLTNVTLGKIEGTPSADDVGVNVFVVSVSDGTNEPVKAIMELGVLPAP